MSESLTLVAAVSFAMHLCVACEKSPWVLSSWARSPSTTSWCVASVIAVQLSVVVLPMIVTATLGVAGRCVAPPGVGIRASANVPAPDDHFKALAPGRKVVHLASHGFFLDADCASASEVAGGAFRPWSPAEPSAARAENPLLLSGIALAGANKRESAPPDGEDGVLTAEEVGALDLSGTEWVVLSGCDTGIGPMRSGEGVLGLSRAFRAAGARTLVLSLWPVDDESARQWMRALYDLRFVQGRSTADAVRGASLDVLRRRRTAGKSTHPLFWGGFIATGDRR